jgi:outer membrane protein OmpA-like peptidoglycan-associated protein
LEEMNMTTQMFKSCIAPLAFIAMLLFGCATAPERVSILEEAQKTYAAASVDSNVVQYAPIELKRAGESLSEAQRLQNEGADPELISHHAYLAKQRTEIARQAAQSAMARQAIDTASQERSQILLQAREREAEIAKQQLAKRERQAQSAQEAQQRAQELEQQLAELKAKRTERGVVLTLPEVFFDVGKATLKPGAYRAIDRLAEIMKQNSEITVRADGFTDSTGPEDFNRELSDNRAEAVRTALIERGIEPNRVVARGLGESLPVATNETVAGRQQNRRVEIVMLNMPTSGEGASSQQ